jgi:hypothetical protein
MARARDAFAEIGLQARRSNLARLAELDLLWLGVSTDALTEAQRERGATLAHQLVGSAGTFGYPGVAGPARQLEDFFAGTDLRSAAAAGSSCLQQIRQELDVEASADLD